jgi:hypothetical protein
MATLNWTGASSANWATAGNWIDQATGLAPATAPTAADDVRFGVGTGATNNACTIGAGSLCRSWTVDGYTGTITHNSGTALNIGDATAGLSNYAINFVTSGWTYTLSNAASSSCNIITTSATQQSIKTNGKTFGNFTTNGVGNDLIFTDAFTSTGAWTHTNGSINTNSQTMTSTTFTSSTNVTRSITLGTTTWNLTGTAATTVWNIANIGTLTASFASSTIVIASTTTNTRTISPGALTYGTLRYTVAGSTGSLTVAAATSFYDIEFSDASNARTCTLSGNQVLRSPTALNSFRGTSGNLMSLVSSVGGTQRVVSRTGKGQTDTNYVALTDIRFAEAYRYFMGANSTSSNSLNGTLTAKPDAPLPTQGKYASNAPGTSASLTFDNAVAAGELILFSIAFVLDPGTFTPPTGFTLAEEHNSGTSVYVKTYYKVADGTETSISASWVNSVNNDVHIGEYDNFNGTPTLDVTDQNDSASATSLVSGAGVSNTTSRAVAINTVGGAASLGASTFATPPTNSFQEHYEVTAGRMRLAILPLTSAASRSTTQTWTTSRVPVSTLVIFKDVSSAFKPQVIFMG